MPAFVGDALGAECTHRPKQQRSKRSVGTAHGGRGLLARESDHKSQLQRGSIVSGNTSKQIADLNGEILVTDVVWHFGVSARLGAVMRSKDPPTDAEEPRLERQTLPMEVCD